MDNDKIVALRDLILALHAGEGFSAVKARFDRLMEDVSPDELTAMEQQLIRDGLPVEEVQRLCDLHVGVVKERLANQGVVDLPPGHPIHTYMKENRRFEKLANRLVRAASSEDTEDIAEILTALAEVDIHYLRKENQLFPYLERHGVTGPTQVMWGVHDEIRDALHALKQNAGEEPLDEIEPDIADVARSITEMIYKEEKILFPMALGKLSDEEWKQMRRGEAEIGYAFETPPKWPEGSEREPVPMEEVREGAIPLSTGRLLREQLDGLLTRLPVEISFVDAEDRVQFYSDHPGRIFPRTPAVIGRHVTNCHPPKSVDKVVEILDAFKDGARSEARFWIQLDGRLILIQYFAVRDRNERYLGCLEATQDVTEIRTLDGEKRLLDWE